MVTPNSCSLVRRTLAGLLLMALALLVPARTLAAPPSRFTPVGDSPDGLTLTAPDAIRPDHRVRVVLRMTVQPVAVVRSQRLDRTLTRAETDGIVQRIHAEHQAAEPHVRALGGRVLARFSHALNGLKVEVARRDLAKLASIPGVVQVLPVIRHTLDNAVSVPFIGAPLAWAGTPAFHGESVKIAVIDTGIDFTHANFGGPGTGAAWVAAFAASTVAPDPALFGCAGCKVKGGTDLVGDAYDADSTDPAINTPVPDPNPLDCNGHGSHVAGTAAGYGVAGGTTYAGPYDATTYSTTFDIGPGVAPRADVYSVRVFGCAGTSEVVADAIDWAVANGADVINMSLGSTFGSKDSADALAATNAVAAGVLVVASAGNSGNSPFITGSPAVGEGVASVAATDASGGPTFPAVTMALSTGQSITAQVSNGASVAGLTAPLDVVVLRNANGTVSLGCNEAEYVDAVITGKLVVTLRGTCARVFRAGAGQKHGAAAVAMIDTSTGFPPFEGPIGGGDPTTNPFDPVTIPFLGVPGLVASAASPGGLLAGAATATMTPTTIPNVQWKAVATFSSGGPRLDDAALKPSVAAPGVNILSTSVGSGTLGERLSGTSMAAPHVTGVMALSRQAHPTWSVEEQRAAVLQTADPAQIVRYDPRLAGAGLVQPALATQTQAILEVDETGLSFGVDETLGDVTEHRSVSVKNHGRRSLTFAIAATQVATGAGVTVTTDRATIRVPAFGRASFSVKLKIPAGAISPTHDPVTGAQVFQDMSGFVTLTPASGQNGGAALRVPYYVVPRVRSNLVAFSGRFGPKHTSAPVFVSNFWSPLAAFPDFYTWGLSSPPGSPPDFAPRAVGVQTNPISATNSILVFAVETWKRFAWSDLAYVELDLTTNGSATPNFAVIAADLNWLQGLPFGGTQFAVGVYDFAANTLRIRFLADAPSHGSTILLPFLASDAKITTASPRFTYTALVESFSAAGQAVVPGTGSFNAFTPSLTVSGITDVVLPNTFATATVTVDPVEWAATPARGVMMVGVDNRSGPAQANLLPAR